jgi:hypothetical protein
MFSFDWLELFKKSSFLRFTPLLSAFGLVIVVVGSTFVYVNTLTREIGYPGVGMQVTANEEVLADLVEQNSAMYRDPEFVPPPLNTDGPRAGDAYQNLQVLGHLSTTQFTRLMLALNQWVAPPNSPGPRRPRPDGSASTATSRATSPPTRSTKRASRGGCCR